MTRFESARLKVERANKHIDDLTAAFGAFLKTDFGSLRIEPDADGVDVLTFESVIPLPRDVPLIIGDAFHNLRSALDHVAYEIVAAKTTPSRHVAFPFAKGRDELIEALHDGEIEAAGGRALVNVIVDSVRPYKGGNDALYALHKLDIGDKYKLLVPLVTVIALMDVTIVDENRNTFKIGSLQVGEGGKLNAIRADTGMHIANHGHPAFAVVFSEGQFFEGKAVLPTLHDLSQVVSSAIDSIEKGYNP